MKDEFLWKTSRELRTRLKEVSVNTQLLMEGVKGPLNASNMKK